MRDPIAELIEIGWLLQTLPSAEKQRLSEHAGFGGRDTKDGDPFPDSKPAPLSQEGQTVHPRHHQIEKNHVETMRVKRVQSRLAGADENHIVSSGSQDQHLHVANIRVVFHQQDTKAGGHSKPSSLC
jgi:hypothetical protein